MVADMVIDEGRDEVVGVVVTRLQPQKQRNIVLLTGFLEIPRQQLIFKEFVILPLHGEFKPEGY